MKKLLLSVLSVGVVAVVAVFATQAFFSDEEKSVGNTFTAGKLDLKVDDTCTYNGAKVESCTWESKDLNGEVFFNYEDVKPGDKGENTISLTSEDNDAWLCAYVKNLSNNDNGITEPESAVDTTDGAGKGELQNYIHLKIWQDTGIIPQTGGQPVGKCDNVYQNGEPVLVEDTTIDTNNGVWPLFTPALHDGAKLIGKEKTCLGVAWNVPAEVGNVIQSDSVTGDVSFYIEQARNNPNFTCPGSEVVYNSFPDPLTGNVPSQAFEATSTSEFGGQIALTGTKRKDPTVTVLMSSWGCESGNWNLGTCSTTAGSTFSEPITLNIYGVGAGNVPGALLATKTQTFNIPYRPSADNTNCTGGNAGKWFDGTTCYNGLATQISFDVTGVTLPDNIIVSLAYNTTHYGYAPIGEGAACYGESGGCGYDSLNVGAQSSGSVTYPLPNDAYLNSTWTGAYCDNGASGTGTFRLDASCWGGYQPVIKIEAN